MEIDVYQNVIEKYGLNSEDYNFSKVGSGHIHISLKLTPKYSSKQSFVLQRINTNVFKNPEQIASNWKLVLAHLDKHFPDYRFLRFIPTKSGENFAVVNIENESQYWRLLPFIENGFVNDKAETLEQISLAAFAYGDFARKMNGCSTENFYEVLPKFHNSAFRWQQFVDSLKNVSKERENLAKESMEKLKSYYWIVEKAENLQNTLPKRIQHTDAKVGNVMFVEDKKQKTILLDLDTIMPGTFLSDVGDLIRSMATDAAEDEADETKIIVFPERIDAVRKGYLEAMEHVLVNEEKQNFMFAGLMLVQMQASRFLTDFLMEDVYYPIQYETHNLVRAKNQLCLLDRLCEVYK